MENAAESGDEMSQEEVMELINERARNLSPTKKSGKSEKKATSPTESTADSDSSIPETIDVRTLGPNDPVIGDFYFGKGGAMYAKDLTPEEKNIKKLEYYNPMSHGPGRFVYRNMEFVWSRDDLRHLECDEQSDVKLPPSNWKEIMKEKEDEYYKKIEEGKERIAEKARAK